jgi:iron complex outermembrane receptor protein
MSMSFSTTNSIQVRTKLPDMLSRDQFIDVMSSEGTAAQRALIGTGNTDWNDEIYQAAFGTDNNLSLSAVLPEHAASGIGGILQPEWNTENRQCRTFDGSVSVSPSFLDDFLKLNLNAKLSHNNNRFANGNAIWAASTFNPTLLFIIPMEALAVTMKPSTIRERRKRSCPKPVRTA